MNNPSFQESNAFCQTIDLSAGLGYGLFYQPILGTSISSDYSLDSLALAMHRRTLHRLYYEKRS